LGLISNHSAFSSFEWRRENLQYQNTNIRISFTGEDFDVVDITTGVEDDFIRVRGAMLHLPGKDKMRVSSSATGEKLVVMDRVLVAATPSYDLYRSDGTKIGWMEKKLISFMDTFDVYMEGKGGFGVTGLFKPDPAYRIEGDFLDRSFTFKNEEGKVVARANMDGGLFVEWNLLLMCFYCFYSLFNIFDAFAA